MKAERRWSYYIIIINNRDTRNKHVRLNFTYTVQYLLYDYSTAATQLFRVFGYSKLQTPNQKQKGKIKRSDDRWSQLYSFLSNHIMNMNTYMPAVRGRNRSQKEFFCVSYSERVSRQFGGSYTKCFHDFPHWSTLAHASSVCPIS